MKEKIYGNFLFEMIKYTRDILMYKVSQKSEQIYNENEIEDIKKIAENTSKEELINIIYKLSELENKMKWTSQKTIIFQTEIIKLCVKQDTKSLENRVEKLENRINNINVTTLKENKKTTDNKIEIKTKKEVTMAEKNEKDVVEKSSGGDTITTWNNILADLKKQGKVILYANLVNTEAIQINDMTVEIRFKSGLSKFRKELLQNSENMNILTKEIAKMCGKVMQIKFIDASTNVEPKKIVETKEEKEENQDDIINSLDISVNIIEE